jgi:hypothetical protein
MDMSNVTALARLPEYEEIQREAYTFAERAKLVVVTDNESYSLAANTLKSIKDYLKRVDDRLEPGKRAAYASYQEWLDLIKDAKTHYLEAEIHIKAQIAKYREEDERLRQAEEARLRQIARQQEEERRLQEALLAELEGNHEEAEEILAEEVYAVPPIVEKTLPKVEGISTVETWKAEIVDLMALVKAVAEGRAPISLLSGNQTAVNSIAKHKGTLTYPGIRVYPEIVVRAGSGRRIGQVA